MQSRKMSGANSRSTLESVFATVRRNNSITAFLLLDGSDGLYIVKFSLCLRF